MTGASTIIRIVDFETTGFPPDAAVCEAAMLDLVPGAREHRWRRGPAWWALVDPGRPIPPEVSAIHHITDDDIVGAMGWGDAAERLQAAEEGVEVIYAAHVKSFEQAFFN